MQHSVLIIQTPEGHVHIPVIMIYRSTASYQVNQLIQQVHFQILKNNPRQVRKISENITFGYNLFKGLCQIIIQVIDVFYAGRKTDHCGGYFHLQTDLFGKF